MDGFKSRMEEAAGSAGRLVLACDDGAFAGAGGRKFLKKMEGLACAVKINMHLLLPLGASRIASVTSAAARMGMLSIADIKLNDIENTNREAAGHLWNMGFDALIANPSMGPQALSELVAGAHEAGRGVIALCHMSSRSAGSFYGMRAGGRRIHDVFRDWASEAGADGLVAGATFPRMIAECKKKAPGTAVYSPGVGAQGGDAAEAVKAGADYLIAGRSLLRAPDPRGAASALAM